VRIVIHALAARMGGARAHVLGLVPELARLAPDDEVLLLAQPDLLADLPPLPTTWTVRAERPQQRGFVARLAWEQAALPRVAHRWRADVLVSFGSFVPLRPGCPSVLEAGNALPFTRAYWDALRREPLRLRVSELMRLFLLRASLASATRILAPTRAMRTDVVSSLPGLAERVDVAVWGVSAVFHATQWQPGGQAVLGVSKHGINKEFDVLVAAIGQIRPDVCLELTGTPDESRWSRRTAALAAQLGLGGRVQFLGDIPNPRVPDLVGRARLVVLPTWCESFGLPLAEALAMGAPAVAADIPACREVGADAACYYRAGDAQSLANALTDMLTRLDDPSQAALISEAARQRGKDFTWQRNAVEVRASLLKATA
jgi:glycosyltransferase involved in cell wall biosynthesis